jgi:hypothetical protein
MPLFILDSSFFIQAHRASYPLDIFPGFWNKMKTLAENGVIISIDKVKDEIFTNDDELKTWIANNLPVHIFKDTQNIQVLNCYKQVIQWAQSRSSQYVQRAIADFMALNSADAWLVAYAASLNEECFLVTQEVSAPGSKSSIKIPDVCIAFNIHYLNIIEMFRRIGETF